MRKTPGLYAIVVQEQSPRGQSKPHLECAVVRKLLNIDPAPFMTRRYDQHAHELIVGLE